MFSWDEEVSILRRKQLDWAEDVPCLNKTSQMYNAYRAAQLRAIAKFCSKCNARQDCLIMALATEEWYGVWGGTTEDERSRVLKELREIPPSENKLKLITTLAKERIAQDETHQEEVVERVDSVGN